MKEKLTSKWLLFVLLLVLLATLVITQLLDTSTSSIKKSILPIALIFFLYCVVLAILSFAVEIFSKGKIHAMLSMNSTSFVIVLFLIGISTKEAFDYKENKLNEYYNSNEYFHSAEYYTYREAENIVDSLGTQYLISQKKFESDSEFINYTCGKSAQSDTFYYYGIYSKNEELRTYQILFKKTQALKVCEGKIEEFSKAEDFAKILGLMISEKERRDSTQNKNNQ